MFRTRITQIIHDTRGNVVGLACIGLVSLVGGAGLGVDTVQWYLWKQQLQQSVEAGALSGAYALSHGGAVATSARREVNRNANLDLTIEAISSPPRSGALMGETDAVEVIATASRTLPFSSLFIDAPTVRARAVAAIIGAGDFCLLALAPTGVGVEVGGTADVDLNCGVAANSVASDSVLLRGSSLLSADPVSSAGGISGASNLAPGITQLPYGNPQTDPFASRNLAMPINPTGCTRTNFRVGSNQTSNITPGRYCNGMDFQGTVFMAPGVYIVDRGDFSVGSQARVTGTGVTIVLTGNNTSNIATMTVNGGGSLDISAPTEFDNAYWQDILIFQDRRGTSRMSRMNGGGTLDLEGIIYMPGGNITYAGTAGSRNECLFLVAFRVTMTGTSNFTNDCPAGYDDSKPRVRRIRIVE